MAKRFLLAADPHRQPQTIVPTTCRHNECHALRAGEEPYSLRIKLPPTSRLRRDKSTRQAGFTGFTPVPSAGATGQAPVPSAGATGQAGFFLAFQFLCEPEKPKQDNHASLSSGENPFCLFSCTSRDSSAIWRRISSYSAIFLLKKFAVSLAFSSKPWGVSI